MGKYYETFLQLPNTQQTIVVALVVFSAILLLSSIALFRAKKSFSIVGGIASISMAVFLVLIAGSMIDPDRGNEVMAAEQTDDPQVINLITTSGSSGGSALVMDVSDDGQSQVDDQGNLPDVDAFSDEMRQAKYGGFTSWLDRANYSVADGYRMEAVEYSLGHEFDDSVDFPIWFQTPWLMGQMGYDHANSGKVNLSMSNVSVEELRAKMDEWSALYSEDLTDEQAQQVKEMFKQMAYRTDDPIELFYRFNLTVDFLTKPIVLDAYLRAWNTLPAFAAKNEWIARDYIPLVDEAFTPDEDGKYPGFTIFFEYPEGHDGQPGWLQPTANDYFRYATNAANILELCTWDGVHQWKSKTNWPLKSSGEDIERRCYEEADPNKQVTERAGIFYTQTKYGKTAGMFGVDEHDRRVETYSFEKRNTPDEPKSIPTSTPAREKATAQPTVIPTSTSTPSTSTDTPTTSTETPDPTPDPTPEPENPPEGEKGKDASFSSNNEETNDQGTGENTSESGKGSEQDKQAAEEALRKQQEAEEEARRQQAEQDAAAEEAARQKAAEEEAKKNLEAAKDQGVSQEVGKVDDNNYQEPEGEKMADKAADTAAGKATDNTVQSGDPGGF